MSRQCKCYGSNENCFYCGGTGLIGDADLATQIKCDLTPIAKKVPSSSSAIRVNGAPSNKSNAKDKSSNFRIKSKAARSFNIVVCKICSENIPNNQIDITLHSIAYHKDNSILKCPYCSKPHHYIVFDSHIKNVHNYSHKNEAREFLKTDFNKPSRSKEQLDKQIKDYKLRQRSFNIKNKVQIKPRKITEVEKLNNFQKRGSVLITCNNCFVKIVSKNYLQHVLNDCRKVKELVKCAYCSTDIKKEEMSKHITEYHRNYAFPYDLSAKALYRNAFRPSKSFKEAPEDIFRDNVESESKRVNLPSVLTKPTKNLDATRNYAHPFREHGRFGTHPSHDDFDEDRE